MMQTITYILLHANSLLSMSNKRSLKLYSVLVLYYASFSERRIICAFLKYPVHPINTTHKNTLLKTTYANDMFHRFCQLTRY